MTIYNSFIDELKFLIKKSAIDVIPYRTRTKEIPNQELPKLIADPTKIFLRKDDGVQIEYQINDGKLNVITPKPTVSGTIIRRNQQLNVPTSVFQNLDGTKAYGEVILLDSNGVALPLHTTVGYMNMKPDTGKQFLEDNNLVVHNTLFDIDSLGKINLKQTPFKDRLDAMKILAPMINAEVPEHATTASQKEKLLSDISEGKNSKSKEGVIIQDLENKDFKTLKSKFKKEYDVYVRGIVPSNRLPDSAAGFQYSHSPEGAVSGKVGTGFSLKERKDMLKHPDKYIGRVAKVRTILKTESGALFQPAFISWHTEKGKSIWV